MHLTVVCPACQSQYQVDATLRGKRMRCPNSICRAIFEVGERAEQAERASPAPIVEAQPQVNRAAPVETPALPPPKWASPPPVRAASASPTPSSVTAPPIEWEIPGDDDGEPAPQTPPVELPTPRNTKRGPWIVVGALAVVLVVAGTTIAIQFLGRQRQVESVAAAQADDLFQKRDFALAMNRFQQLQAEFPKSKDFDRYRFMATLCDLRIEVDAAHDTRALADGRKHAVEFLDSYQASPLLKPHEGDVFEALLQLTNRSVADVKETPHAAIVTNVEAFWRRTRALATRAIAREDDDFRSTVAEVRATIARRDLKEATLAFLARGSESPTAASIAEAVERIDNAALKDDPDVVSSLKALREAHRASIAFVAATSLLPAAATDAFNMIPLVAPVQPPQAARGEDPIVALSPTGVFYAVRASDGALLWGQRLGIDSRLTPLRIANGDNSPARFLVVSNDRKTVALLDGLSGNAVWQHVLAAPAVAEPILTPGHWLLPLVTGRVIDLNPDNGELNGSFQFDQPLPYGGAMLPNSSRVVLPGDAHCVYILDLASRTCVHVIETGHAAGSLFGPPIVVSEEGSKRWIVLTESRPGPQIRLRPIPYPPESAGKRIERDIVIPGRLSVPPRHDAESILLATEDGRLHRFGLRLRGNFNDPLIFPLAPADIAVEIPSTGQSMKALVVHVDAENIWIVCAGRLHRLQQSFSAQDGPTVKSRWPQATWVGEPLLVAQVAADAEGTTLFLATHDPLGPASWLSAVDGETGKILWKTQLGSLARGEPIIADSRIAWHDGRVAFVANLPSADIKTLPIPESPRGTILAYGPNALLLGWSPDQKVLRLTELDLDRNLVLSSTDISLFAPVAAAPIVGENSVIVALTNGILCRVDLKIRMPLNGPDWRAGGADVNAPTLVLRAGPELFIAADGAGGLVAFDWGANWKEVARYKPSDGRRIGPTILLPGSPARLLAVDDNGHIFLFDAGKLQILSRTNWDLKGKATAGPFAIGDKAFVVVDGKRLVAIDPSHDGLRWDVAFLAEIACAPLLLEKRLVVADLNGNFWTLDPETGANLIPNDRPALSVVANLAPAVPPIPLPDGKLFVLWSDGTAGVVSLGK